MYCVICLKNRAREFLCPYCHGNARHLFTEGQILVAKEVKKDFDSLPMNMKWKVIYLTNKRLGKMLKAGLQSEFSLNRLIAEYTEMVLLRHKELEFPVLPNDFNMNLTVYRQYQTLKGQVL